MGRWLQLQEVDGLGRIRTGDLRCVRATSSPLDHEPDPKRRTPGPHKGFYTGQRARGRTRLATVSGPARSRARGCRRSRRRTGSRSRASCPSRSPHRGRRAPPREAAARGRGDRSIVRFSRRKFVRNASSPSAAPSRRGNERTRERVPPERERRGKRDAEAGARRAGQRRAAAAAGPATAAVSGTQAAHQTLGGQSEVEAHQGEERVERPRDGRAVRKRRRIGRRRNPRAGLPAIATLSGNRSPARRCSGCGTGAGATLGEKQGHSRGEPEQQRDEPESERDRRSRASDRDAVKRGPEQADQTTTAASVGAATHGTAAATNGPRRGRCPNAT